MAMTEARAGVRLVRNYVGGEWRVASAERRLPVHNPATGEVLAEVPVADATEVDRAVRAAAAAFPAWRSVPPHERVQPLYRLKALLDQHQDELARIVTTEHGKTLDDARGSVRRGIENVEVACGIPSLLMGYGLEDGAARGIDEWAVRVPLGVFGAICPFNFPAMVPFWFWPYAVACGNTFVLKPSERVPLTQQRIFELVEQAGFPPGVINLVNGDRETVEALLDHPEVVGVSFVGSTPVARHIYTRAAASGKRVQAQGGAKNALVVMPDARLDQAVPNILGSAFGASGQRCLAGSLLITVGDAHDRVLERLVPAAKALRVGNGLDPGVDVGPVISRAAQERIIAAIDRAVAEGAKAVVDGRGVRVPGGEQGYFVGPTVLDEVRPDQEAACEEIFGPVLSVLRARDLDEAIALIDRLPFGNAASIYTQAGAAARAFQYRVNVGNVGINVGVAAPMAFFPFGGRKASFFGTLHGQGRDAIEFCTDKKVVISRWY